MKKGTIEFTFSPAGEIEANIDLGPECCFDDEKKLLDAIAEEGVVLERQTTFCNIPLTSKGGLK